MRLYVDRNGTAPSPRRFIACDRYRIADAFPLSALDFGIACVAGFEIPEERAHLLRWHREVSARPSARA